MRLPVRFQPWVRLRLSAESDIPGVFLNRRIHLVLRIHEPSALGFAFEPLRHSRCGARYLLAPSLAAEYRGVFRDVHAQLRLPRPYQGVGVPYVESGVLQSVPAALELADVILEAALPADCPARLVARATGAVERIGEHPPDTQVVYAQLVLAVVPAESVV